MLTNLFKVLTAFITLLISSLGYGGIVLAMAIESACIPLPSEIIMPFAGYLVFKGTFILWQTALAGALGCVVGSIVAYGVGYYGGREFILKYGKYILISQHDVGTADHLFQKHGQAVVFFSRLLPIIRTFISLPAGIAKMPFGKFVFYSFIGSYPWCYGLAWAGMKLGENWEGLRPWFHRFDFVIVALGILAVIYWLKHHLGSNKRALP